MQIDVFAQYDKLGKRRDFRPLIVVILPTFKILLADFLIGHGRKCTTAVIGAVDGAVME